jgi:long-chain-fatty-acid--CoA ligase ACSBG
MIIYQHLGSIPAITIPQAFMERYKLTPNHVVYQVERNNEYVKWTWAEFKNDVFAFAKAMSYLGVNERKCVNIIGFNSPEWVISFFAAILYNAVPAGVYTTNNPDACFYVADHSEAEVIVVEDHE